MRSTPRSRCRGVGLIATALGAVLLSGASGCTAETDTTKASASETLNPCAAKTINPCAAKTLNPCAAKTLNPCLAKTLNACAARTLNACDAKNPPAVATEPARSWWEFWKAEQAEGD